MPRCIALGCTSGYTSNKEKVHFFFVPKDENIRQMWQAALKRTDIIINTKTSCMSSSLFTYRHFVET